MNALSRRVRKSVYASTIVRKIFPLGPAGISTSDLIIDSGCSSRVQHLFYSTDSLTDFVPLSEPLHLQGIGTKRATCYRLDMLEEDSTSSLTMNRIVSSSSRRAPSSNA
mmetsp:Transcript_22389/g.32161  ORF Transcript_22389/g.32161 Transcript_22389/m.32161 type:complete len:109 (-) Transcript_22389:1532-1858(-)